MFSIKKAVTFVCAVFFLVIFTQIVRYGVFFSGISQTYNTEGAWGLPISADILSVCGLLLVVFFLACTIWGKISVLTGGAIVSGGIANLFERMTLGYVTDYIEIFPGFPAFNVADVFITLGAILFLWEIWENKERNFEINV